MTALRGRTLVILRAIRAETYPQDGIADGSPLWWDRARQAYVPVTLEPFPPEEQENKTRRKYLEKLRRLCLLMRRMGEEDAGDGMNKAALYREVLPGIPDRTRQRDFKELEKLGYKAKYLGDYLDACPAGARHLLLCSHRRGNGPSPQMSAFMDFWVERGVDILDLGDVDKEVR